MKQSLLLALLLASINVFCAPWELKNGPSCYTKQPDVIRLIPGETQGLIFYLVAPDDVIAASKTKHNLTATFTLPDDMEIVCSSAEKESIAVTGNQTRISFVLNKIYLHNHGTLSEWRTWRIAAKVPNAMADSTPQLTLQLDYEGTTVTQRTWNLQLMPPLKQATALKYFKLGFFDNGYSALRKAHPQLVAFWKRAGLNCVFTNTLVNVPADQFTSFGGLHFAHFANTKFPTVNAKGNNTTHFVDGFYLRNHSLQDILPKITQRMVDNATTTDSHWTGMDYEVNGLDGFLPESIKAFKKEYAVSDEAFDSMRNLMVQHGHKAWDKATAEQQKTILAWNDYQSELHMHFVRELSKLLKNKLPDGKLYNTCNDTLPPPDPRGLHLAEDASMEAQYLDMIAPQIYSGYDEKAAKYAIIRVGQWKKRLQELKTKCLLHPYILVRYGGADLRNSPAKLRQQTIGAAAEGADGVSYYYLQDFDGNDWQELATTVNALAAVEDFYHFGTRCDERISIAEPSMQREATYVTWPESNNNLTNPDWHATAHRHNGKILVTLLNLNEQETFSATLTAHGKLLSVKGGTLDTNTSRLTVQPDDIAFITFEEN